MKKYLLFGLCLFISGFSYADETVGFDDSTEIKPMTKELSSVEAAKGNSSDLDDFEGAQVLPDVLCSDAKLKKQLENFVYAYINIESTGSIIEQRRRYLLARNLHDFAEVSDKDLSAKNNYSAASVVAYLKINENKKIYRICRSSDNNSEKFADLFAVIYRDGSYYKVVVPNVMLSTKNIDKATFVYNW